MPIVSLKSSPFQVLWTNYITLYSLIADIKLSLNLFNVNMGCWELFIEKLSFSLVQLKDF